MNKNTVQTTATRKRIIDAFIELYKANSIEKITIEAISKKAGINRSTFYQYFSDIYDLLEQYENELIAEINEKIQSIFAGGIPKSLDIFSRITASIFSIYDDRIFALLSSKGDVAFQQKLKKSCLPTLGRYINITENTENYDYLTTYAFLAAISLISYWYETGKQIPTEEFVRLMQSLITNGVLGYTGIQVFN